MGEPLTTVFTVAIAGIAYDFKEGDSAHFNRKGGEAIAGLIIPALIRILPQLDGCLIHEKPGENRIIGNPKDRRAFDEAMAVQWPRRSRELR